ncbi:MAG: hypothetical protein ABI388_04050 [Bacteroidia bacterium]
MRLFLLFCLISVTVFGQKEKQTVFIQGGFGFTSYVNPSTKIAGSCPSAEINFISNNSKKDSAKINACFIAGFSFVRTKQLYNVQDTNSIIPAPQNFYTNEFLLSLGGVAKFNLSKKIYLNIGGGVQIGADFTWSPSQLVSIYKIKAINTSQSVTAQNGYTTITELTPYKWEYYQFYVFGKIQLGINVSKRVSVFAGITTRFFICKNNISEETDMLQLNYSPLKLTANAGVQVKLFK